MQPYLLFDFIDDVGEKKSYKFQHPIRIYETNDLTQVESIFKQMENDIASGYYLAGYLSYEAAPAFEKKYRVHGNPQLPLLWFAVFNSPTNHCKPNQLEEDYQVSNWSLTSNFQEYQEGIAKIKKAIENGDTYQVNYTASLQANFRGNDYSFYKQLSRNQQASYNAYLNIGQYRILSASPELFFRVKDNNIYTKPMKGTVSRGRFSKEDKANKKALRESEKEQAENLMIVDLLRNDIGRIAKPGSVKVPKLFEVESYPTVHQMTSTIEATLEDNVTIYEWFQALFPCGSITGAPKLRTMDYIADLELTPREVYCGAIGFITPNREATFNVPIRTVIIDKSSSKATYGVGGGVTWDSTVVGEYNEILTKARLLTERRKAFELLESLRLDNGKYPLLEYHMTRLTDSADYFKFNVNISEVIKALENLAINYPFGNYKVRLVVNEFGNITLTHKLKNPLNGPISCALAKTPVDNQDPFLFHKTTHRQIYEVHQTDLPTNLFSVLLWNEQEELTEFTIGNLVVEKNGTYYTPPIECGLLAGTFRQQLLNESIIVEKVLDKKDLATFDTIWFINSVRGWLEVKLV